MEPSRSPKEQVLRQRDRRLVSGVRAVAPSGSWPDLLADELDDEVTAGARRICIVSPDVWGPVRDGRVGTLYRNLAFQLNDSGHLLTLLYTSPRRCEDGELSDWIAYYKERNIHLVPLPDPEVPHLPGVAAQQRSASYAVLEWLRTKEPFDVVHSPEIGAGLYHSLWAKRARLAFHGTTFVVGTHGGHWWNAEGGFRVFDDLSSVLEAEMELRCVELADVVVSPSQHMLHWLETHDVVLPDRTFVWPNAGEDSDLEGSQDSHGEVNGLAFLGEFEPRAGIHLFLHALRALPRKRLRDMPIWFLGEPSRHFKFDAALDALRSDRPEIEARIQTDLSRDEARSIMRDERLLAVAPALLDDAPSVVSTCISGGVPLIATNVGGVREMLHPSCHDGVLCDPNPPDIANAIRGVLENGGTVPVAANSAETINSMWSDWHSTQPEAIPIEDVDQESRRQSSEVGDVTVCVVHHEQPDLLPGVLGALASQTLRPARIIVVDNGSSSDAAKTLLRELSEVGEIDGVELTILRAKNRYPGWARNRAAREATTEYVVFADDDNVAKPDMIEKLVRACESDPETACFTCFADYFHDGDEPSPSTVTHRGVFLGGLGVLGALENFHGDTNSIIRRRAFEAVGGFHEVWGIGREDQDIFLRLSVGGYGVGVVPEALFYYRLTDSRIRRSHLSLRAGPSRAAMSGAAPFTRDVRLLVEGARGVHSRINPLRKKVGSLRRRIKTERLSHRSEVKVVRGNLRSLEKRLMAERQRFGDTQERLKTERESHRTILKQFRGTTRRLRATEEQLRAIEEQLAATQEQLAATKEQLTDAESARSDLRWLLRRLDGTPAKYVLRHFEGYNTLLRRYL